MNGVATPAGRAAINLLRGVATLSKLDKAGHALAAILIHSLDVRGWTSYDLGLAPKGVGQAVGSFCSVSGDQHVVINFCLEKVTTASEQPDYFLTLQVLPLEPLDDDYSRSLAGSRLNLALGSREEVLSYRHDALEGAPPAEETLLATVESFAAEFVDNLNQKLAA